MSTRSANTITTTAGANPGESGVLVFTHDEEIPEDAEATPQAVQSRLPSHGRKRGNSEAIATEDDTDDDGRGSRWRKTGRYGAIGVSEPLVAGGQQVTIENTRATAGNSRSRSKGRTPPRTIVRPMTRARRDAALAAGASLTALPPVMGSSLASASTEDDAADHSPVTPATPNAPFSFGAARRGRSAEERPMSPVVALRPLPSSSEDDQEYEDEEDIAIARNMARRASFLAGGSAFGGSAFTRLTFDPAEELDAQDLNLPTDEDGNEVHAWRKALAAEFPLIVRSTFPIFLAQLAEYSLALTSVISIGHLGTTELAASSMANMTASVVSYNWRTRASHLAYRRRRDKGRVKTNHSDELLDHSRPRHRPRHAASRRVDIVRPYACRSVDAAHVRRALRLALPHDHDLVEH
jgi:MATE family multidrug resistance protein